MRESMPHMDKAQQNFVEGFVVLKPTQIQETDEKRNLRVGKNVVVEGNVGAMYCE